MKNSVLLLALLLSGFSALALRKPTEKPNIVFILADDLGYGDVGAYGQQKIKTPNLDRLARQGRKFTQFYSGATVCAPSRANLMTGLHTGHAYIRGNGEIPLRAQDVILPQYLQQSGYTTGLVGKWGLGLKGTAGVPEKKGWDYFTGYLHHVEGHYQQADSVWQLINGITKQIPVPQQDYVNELFTKSALEFIDKNQQKPFFLYVAFTLPHAELKVPERYLKQYLTADGQSIFPVETPHPVGRHYGPQPNPRAAYAAMVTSVDDYVGWILKKLAHTGLEENTLVVFTSDNGTHQEGGRTLQDAQQVFKSSGPLRGIKRDLYEGGIRVPFITYWKGQIKPNTISTHVGAFWDILPTFTALAGQPTAAKTDGISFVPTLLDKGKQPRHQALYWEFYEQGFKQAVRQDQWKAIRFYKNGQPEHTELYDLKNDVGEQRNIAVQNPDKVKALEALLDRERTPSELPNFQIKPVVSNR